MLQAFASWHQPELKPPRRRWEVEKLPAWTEPFLLSLRGNKLAGVKYLLTFEPFERLPAAMRRAYLAGELHLLPFPGSLVFWGIPSYCSWAQLPLPVQIPLLNRRCGTRARWASACRNRAGCTSRTSTSPSRSGMARSATRSTARIVGPGHRDDALAGHRRRGPRGPRAVQHPADDIGLYGKPMARNCPGLDPRLRAAARRPPGGPRRSPPRLRDHPRGRQFGYRFHFPPMQVGAHQVYWHRPLAAFGPRSTAPKLLHHAPGLSHGLPASTAARPAGRALAADSAAGNRAVGAAGLRLETAQHRRPLPGGHNVRKFLYAWDLLGEPSVAVGLRPGMLTLPKQWSLEEWLRHVEEVDGDSGAGRWLAEEARQGLGRAPRPVRWAGRPTSSAPQLRSPSTIPRRSFEVAYWRTIARLATGRFVNKDNANCADLDHAAAAPKGPRATCRRWATTCWTTTAGSSSGTV